MRIIAGEFRGRKLLAPDGDVTRPITDRVKQSLFDILTPHIEGAVVLDLFAGTGSMGLECVSRGAKQVFFFEADRSAISRLRQNLQAIGVSEPRAIIHPADIFRWFGGCEIRKQKLPPEEPKATVDLTFLDPPYRFLRERPHDLQKLAQQLAKFVLKNNGIVVFRHDAADALELAPLERYDVREYGGMTLEFLSVA